MEPPGRERLSRFLKEPLGDFESSHVFTLGAACWRMSPVHWVMLSSMQAVRLQCFYLLIHQHSHQQSHHSHHLFIKLSFWANPVVFPGAPPKPSAISVSMGLDQTCQTLVYSLIRSTAMCPVTQRRGG